MFTTRRHPFILITSLIALMLATASAMAAYEPPRAALMIDVNKQQTLFEENATALRHPASLTKMMTLYMVFEALDQGSITLETGVVASRHSADRPPSRLGHSMGEIISVDLAIDALVVRSANDVAAAVGEMLGGTEEDFAKKMTVKARQLGMKDTVYKNASGLPDKDQVTTARDQALLGIALKRDFPEYYPRFSVPSVTYKDRTWTTHNNLLGEVDTVTGIKTGFINASGFNIVTYSEETEGDKIVVVMGGRNAKERDQAAIDILNGRKPAHQLTSEQLIARNAADRAREKAAELARQTAQQAEIMRGSKLILAAVEIKQQALGMAEKVVEVAETATQAPEAKEAAAQALAFNETVSGNEAIARIAEESQEAAPADASPAVENFDEPAKAAALTTGALDTEPLEETLDEAPSISRYAIQVGALPTQERAMERLTLARPALQSHPNALRQYTVPLETSRGMVYRARIIGFEDMQSAFDACETMEAQRIECMALIQK